MSLFDIGVSGLRAQQTALATVGQNITNASTPGYTRQRVVLQAEQAGSIGNGFAATQVQIEGVERITDELASAQLRFDESQQAEMAALVTQIESVDTTLFRNGNGLGEAFSAFFAAIDAANVNPGATTERRLVLETGDRLVDQFATVQNQLDAQTRDLNTALIAAADEISALASSLAELNVQIGVARGTGTLGADNQLLNQRDEHLRELSRLVGVKAIINGEEQVNVFIGKGQPLVLGAEASRLSVDPRNAVLLETAGQSPLEITRSVVGGEVGGLLSFESDVLRPTQQRLGRLALGFTNAFNERHREGVNQNGLTGRDFFNGQNDVDLVQARVYREDRLTTSPASMTLLIEDVNAVPLSDYRLTIADDLDGGYQLQRLSDGQVLLSGRIESLAQPVAFDGLQLTVDVAGLAPGQSYRLSPFAFAADQLSLVVSDGGDLALAQGAEVSPSPANLGSGELVLDALETTGGQLNTDDLPDQLLLRFQTEDRFEVLDNSNPAAPRPLSPPLRSLPFALGQTASLVNTEAGVNRIQSTTLQVGKPQPPLITTDPAQVPTNGYLDQTLTFTGIPTTSGSAERVVSLTQDATARESAEALSILPGVTATAYTELQVSEISASVDAGPPIVQINDVALGAVSDPAQLVALVNGAEDLAQRGIDAALINDRAVVRSAYGDDLSLVISGAPETYVSVQTDRGQELDLRGQGIGDPPVVIGSADIRGPISFSSSSDFSLFVSNGDDAGATIEISGSYASAADFVFDLQAQLDAALGPNQVQVGLNPGGQLRIVGRDSGSSATLTVVPNGPLAGFLGISPATVSGNERYASTTVGGTIALELADGVTARAIGSGPFAAEPDTTTPRSPLGIRLVGSPQAGDAFAISFAAENPLGNRIGLELSELQNLGVIGQSRETVSDALAETVEFVGLKGSQAQADEQAAAVLVEQSKARVESISGVNLDEEAADLIRFEQAYNASAQVIAVARDIFTTLIQAIA